MGYISVLKYVAPVLIVGFLWWRYDYVVTQNEQLQSDLSKANEQLEQTESLIIRERQNAAEVALRAQKYFEQRARDNEELEKLRACYADKSCWPRVRVKTSCPAMPGSTSDAGTPEEITAELGTDAGQNILRLRSQIKEITSGYIALQQELEARSRTDYCAPVN